MNTVNANVPIHMSHFHCIFKLVQRRLLTFYRDTTDFRITFIQAPILVLAFFLVFQEIITIDESSLFRPLRNYLTSDTVSVIIFLVILTSIWFGTSKAIIEIPASRILYRQEQLSFLKNSDYIIAIFISLSIIVLGQVILFSVSFHLLFIALPAWVNPFETGLVLTQAESVSFFTAFMPLFLLKFIALMWLVAMASIAVAMFISVFIATRSAASAILPFVLIVQILMGGSVIKPIIDMNPIVNGIANTMVSRWGFETAVLLFEQELNFFMPRYTTGDMYFTTKSFVGTDKLALKTRNANPYIACLKESWQQHRNNKPITCDQYDNVPTHYNAPMVTTRHPEILIDWYQALYRSLDAAFFMLSKNEITAKNKIALQKIKPFYKTLDKYLTAINTDKKTVVPAILKNTKLPAWILDKTTQEFYGVKGFPKKVKNILVKSECIDANKAIKKQYKCNLNELNIAILEHAISIDPRLKLFRVQNYPKTWLILGAMTSLFLFLTWFFFNRNSKKEKMAFL